MLDKNPDSYIKLNFELLRIELREFEALVSQLKESLNSSSPLLDSLYIEVKRSKLSVAYFFDFRGFVLTIMLHICARFTT